MDPLSFAAGSAVTLTVIAAAYLIRHRAERTPSTTTGRSTSSQDQVTANELPDDEKLPAPLAVLALLDANDGEPIEGITRMQKLVFLMQEEWENYSDEPYPFEKYDFEPHDY